jgi:hypothetical protein
LTAVSYNSLRQYLTYPGQAFEEPEFGLVDVLTLKLAVSRGDQLMPPIARELPEQSRILR